MIPGAPTDPPQIQTTLEHGFGCSTDYVLSLPSCIVLMDIRSFYSKMTSNSYTDYEFHQTPAALAKDLIATLSLDPTDRLYEPFKGEGSFYDNFPASNPKDWAEITKGRDFRTHETAYDWVITNPPFRVDDFGKKGNAIFPLIDYFTDRATKGVAFLVSDQGLGTLTRLRRQQIQAKGWDITQITMCEIKKWRGRYYFIVLQPSTKTCLSFLPASY